MRVNLDRRVLPAATALLAILIAACAPKDAEPVAATAPDMLTIGGFSGLGAATQVAHQLGFLEAEGINLVFNSVDSSEELMTKFIDGEFDLIQTNADNIIAWAEGQGIDGTPHDFAIVLGGYRGREPMQLTVVEDIQTVDDLRGRVLAVDALHTGYAPMLVYILSEEGLVWNEDYTLESVGGGPMRAESMKAGETSGGLVELDEELAAMGFHVLLTSREYIQDYARAVTASRRDWAEQHSDLIVRYNRAMIRSINWLLDPANKAEAISVIMADGNVSAAEAEDDYAAAINPDFGFIPNAEIRPGGVSQIIKIRGVMGAMQTPLPEPQKYIEDRYYKEAMATLDR
jgi:ABC-type nitrate/sulfonate/bicarbonate transport system substrate-binding protein